MAVNPATVQSVGSGQRVPWTQTVVKPFVDAWIKQGDLKQDFQRDMEKYKLLGLLQNKMLVPDKSTWGNKMNIGVPGGIPITALSGPDYLQMMSSGKGDNPYKLAGDRIDAMEKYRKALFQRELENAQNAVDDGTATPEQRQLVRRYAAIANVGGVISANLSPQWMAEAGATPSGNDSFFNQVLNYGRSNFGMGNE